MMRQRLQMLDDCWTALSDEGPVNFCRNPLWFALSAAQHTLVTDIPWDLQHKTDIVTVG